MHKRVKREAHQPPGEHPPGEEIEKVDLHESPRSRGVTRRRFISLAAVGLAALATGCAGRYVTTVDPTATHRSGEWVTNNRQDVQSGQNGVSVEFGEDTKGVARLPAYTRIMLPDEKVNIHLEKGTFLQVKRDGTNMKLTRGSHVFRAGGPGGRYTSYSKLDRGATTDLNEGDVVILGKDGDYVGPGSAVEVVLGGYDRRVNMPKGSRAEIFQGQIAELPKGVKITDNQPGTPEYARTTSAFTGFYVPSDTRFDPRSSGYSLVQIGNRVIGTYDQYPGMNSYQRSHEHGMISGVVEGDKLTAQFQHVSVGGRMPGQYTGMMELHASGDPSIPGLEGRARLESGGWQNMSLNRRLIGSGL
ncbi:hypothetical protein ACFLRC_02580 [Candidatus Altiarchaeota archaeon]